MTADGRHEDGRTDKRQGTEADVRGETDRREQNDGWAKKRNVISCQMDSIMDNRQEVDLFEESVRK